MNGTECRFYLPNELDVNFHYLGREESSEWRTTFQHLHRVLEHANVKVPEGYVLLKNHLGQYFLEFSNTGAILFDTEGDMIRYIHALPIVHHPNPEQSTNVKGKTPLIRLLLEEEEIQNLLRQENWIRDEKLERSEESKIYQKGDRVLKHLEKAGGYFFQNLDEMNRMGM